jgi:molybdopterin-guanine dinucleotide biosynthesis protein A
MYSEDNLYGLVLCGGRSSRMGEDKSFIVYHGKPQCYHVYEMLQQFCTETFISCNANQSHLININFKIVEDQKVHENKGPATGVLTAFSTYPEKNFLVIGCDYPFLTAEEIRHFLASIPRASVAAAFYNHQEQCYQPVIAWYSSEAGAVLKKSQVSLKQLLHDINAYKHTPLDPSALISVDTKAASEQAKLLANNNH